jgi:N-methylhydantoinase A/oxoprolinase/acetone carboxylase beta subunit
MRRVGIDVGGTNTDAVLIAEGKVVRSVKRPTSEDVTSGILAALEALAPEPPVDAVMIGTTHFINAVIQRRELTKVAAMRFGMPAAASLPPFCDWPADIARLVNGGVFMLEGGHDYDGRPIMPFDAKGCRAAAKQIRELGVHAVAVSSIFAPLDPSCETQAAEILAEECPGVAVTQSHRLGRIGLLERENAGLLNAALVDLARKTIAAFEQAIASSGIRAPLYLTQNDGTVMRAEFAAAYPVYSFSSGATNSMRGAAYLSGLSDAMVVDVGGTSSDVGELRHGFPREANNVVEVAGVRTLFRMPDLVSIGLGGGSHVSADGASVGPLSVGYRLTSEARVFGGDRLTATDIAVAAGLLDLADSARVRDLPKPLVNAAIARAHAMLEETVDRMKTDAAPVPLIAVGGGAFLVPDRMAGISEVVRVKHGDCANAVGAAIAQVSGEIDQVFQGLTREAALAKGAELATERAVTAGADAKSVKVVEVEDIPIAYLPGNALRVRVRTVGDIASA